MTVIWADPRYDTVDRLRGCAPSHHPRALLGIAGCGFDSASGPGERGGIGAAVRLLLPDVPERLGVYVLASGARAWGCAALHAVAYFWSADGSRRVPSGPIGSGMAPRSSLWTAFGCERETQAK